MLSLRVMLFLTICIKWTQSDCVCGRGGLCKVYDDEDPSQAVSAEPCSCDRVSLGIFTDEVNQCDILIDHCYRHSCRHWKTCISGFGIPLCICQKSWAGAYCRHKIAATETGQFIHVWYPVSRWSLWAPVIATALPLENAQLRFTFEDNRVYEERENICNQIEFDMLMTRCGSGADCAKLIELSNWTSKYYECSVPVPFLFRTNPYHAVYIDGVLGPVGHYHDVDVEIIENSTTYFYKENFRVFLTTRPFIQTCPYQVKFSGCSGDPDSANEYTAGTLVQLTGTIILTKGKENCPVKEYSYDWSISPLNQYQNMKAIGDEQSVVFKPYDLGIYLGLASVQFEVTFLGIVGMRDELLMTVCYMKLVESKMEVTVHGFSQIYECGMVNEIVLSASITSSSFPEETHTFQWHCARQLCGDPKSELLKVPKLIFRAWVPCSRHSNFHITVDATHPLSKEIAHFQGTLTFSKKPYNLIIDCEPECEKANPAFMLKIFVREEPSRGSTLDWVLPADIKVDTACKNTSEDFIIINPHTLKRNTTYTFQVVSPHGNKSFYVKTLPGPKELSCTVVPSLGHPLRDKFNVSCKVESEYQPLTYWVYEGDNDLVVTSSSHTMTDLELTNGRITIKIVDSVGVMDHLQYMVHLEIPSYGDLLKAKAYVPSRIQELHTKKLAKDHNGMADEVNSITKLSLLVTLPFPWRLTLMTLISHIQLCPGVDCVVKTLNSVRRLLLTSTPVGNDTVGVDDFVLRAGGALFSIMKTLHKLYENRSSTDAYGYVPVLSTVHEAVIQVMEFVDPVLFYPYLDEDIRQIHYRKVMAGTFYARWAMYEMGLFVAQHIALQSPPFEQRTEDEEKKIIVISHNTNYINCILALEKNKSYFQFTPDASHKIDAAQTHVAIAVIDYNKKNFWWAKPKSANYGDMFDVFFYRQLHGEWVHFIETTGSVQAHITSVKIPRGAVTGTVVNPNSSISSTILDGYVNVYRVSVPRGHGCLHLVLPDHLIGRIHVYIDQYSYPDFSTMNATTALNTTYLTYNYYNSEKNPSGVYVGLWTRKMSLNYSLNISLVRCVLWGEGKWKSEMCRYEKFLHDTVVCVCHHMSLFNVVTSIPAVELVPFVNITMDTTMYYNWVVQGVIICVFAIFLFLLCVIRFLDKREKRKATFLADNYPGENYPYLVAVFTGRQHSAGTSAKVAIRLIGDKFISRVHILNPVRSDQILDNGQDGWFILFTKQRLGDIEEIVLWHDNTGPGPDWYCNEVVIWDTTIGSCYVFMVKTWITFTNLHERRDTVFIFMERKRKERRTWKDLVTSLVVSYTRQSHHWISIFFIHPRSPYTRVDRAMLTLVLVLVVIAVCIAFADVGPADRTVIKIKNAELRTAFISVIVGVLVITAIAQILRIGKAKVIQEFMEAIGLVLAKKKPGVRMNFHKYLIFPITFLPIVTEDPLPRVGIRSYRWIRNRWIFGAYLTSGIVIMICVVLTVSKGWGLGRISSLIWITTFMFAICCESFVLNPILIIMTSLLVAQQVRKTSRDLVTIGVDPLEDILPFVDIEKRLSKSLYKRVQPCYKPPTWYKIEAFKAKPSMVECTGTISSLFIFILSLSLVLYFEIQHNFFKNEQLELVFTRSKSSISLDLDSVRNRTRYFDYLRATVLPALHRTTWYNGKLLHVEEAEPKDPFNVTKPTRWYRGFCADYTSKLVGVPRLRQQRVSPAWRMAVPHMFKNAFPDAYPHLKFENEDTKSYRHSWGKLRENRTYYKIYKYSWPEDTGTGKILGPHGSFLSGGGYVETLHWSLGGSLSYLVDLEVDEWLNNVTRYVFFSFNLYNLYADKISYVIVVTECLPSGVYRSRVLIESASFSVAQLPRERTVIIVIAVLAIVLFVHFLLTLTAISQNGIEPYAKSLGGIINLSLLVSGLGVIVTCVNRYINFVATFDDFDTAARDVHSPFYSRFYQNEICLIFIGTFCWFVAADGSYIIYKMFGIEAIEKAFFQFRSVIMAQVAVIMVFYIFYTYFTVNFVANEIPNFFFLLSFKETSRQVLFGESIVYTACIIFATVLFVVNTKFMTAGFYKKYSDADSVPNLFERVKMKRAELEKRTAIVQFLRQYESSFVGATEGTSSISIYPRSVSFAVDRSRDHRRSVSDD